MNANPHPWPAILDEMQGYYDARSGEYDQWFFRTGRYDRGPEHRARWNAEVQTIQAALREMNPTGDVLELAAGTGNWTGLLARTARQVHAIDGSAQALSINRAKHPNAANIILDRADLFTWQPVRTYDLVAAAFWLSHVPRPMLDEHLALIRRALRPGGGIFLVDSLYVPDSGAKDHPPQNQPDHIVTRRLNDGREYRIVKVFYEPGDLEDAFARAGMRIRVRATGEFFLFAATDNADP